MVGIVGPAEEAVIVVPGLEAEEMGHQKGDAGTPAGAAIEGQGG